MEQSGFNWGNLVSKCPILKYGYPNYKSCEEPKHPLSPDHLARLCFDTQQLATLRALGEYRGKQRLYVAQSPEVLSDLRQVAVVESTESSNLSLPKTPFMNNLLLFSPKAGPLHISAHCEHPFWLNVNTHSGLIVNTFRAISGLAVHPPEIPVHVQPESLSTH